jgi:V8-like Glu-specific endopeptidase
MKERGTMPQQPRFLQLPLAGKVFLGVLATVYVAYLALLANFTQTSAIFPWQTIVEHPAETSASIALQYWTPANMSAALDADEIVNGPASSMQSTDASQIQAAQQDGTLPRDENGGTAAYPLSTVGKIFFTNDSGQNMVCSGTAIQSANQSAVDSAGHCLYWNGGWVKNLIFCPMYNNGTTPYDCWAARELMVPADWINAKPNDLHHDLGIAVVSPNDAGSLTDVVGGAGWAYNQPEKRTFSAYGYPAAYPFDGQTRQSCEKATGNKWQFAGGHVISIQCNMTGGSSGGPWFIQISGKWYLNGHNDFTSSIRPGHMFSPYYDNTWYDLYKKAQNA